MDRTIKYTSYVWVMLLTLCFSGCADQTFVDDKSQSESTLLNMYASVNKADTRLAELGNADNMNVESGNKKHQYVGLYIYYEDDYTGKNNNDVPDLSKPYIRNLKCKIEGGKLTPINGEPIYIYDRMTIVAFYPYNEDMSKEQNYFTKKTDEKAYPISESDYIDQKYIPYRAETTVNPTNAYNIRLGFGPVQTSKVEVVLTADDPSSFPDGTSLTDGKVKLLPNIDKLAGNYTLGEDRREYWVDGITNFPTDDSGNVIAPTGGKYVRRYTAYVWKSAALNEDNPHHDTYTHHDNILKKGEVLFESDKLTLIVPATVNLSEQVVYRYGYNLDNGEIFIPTSDILIYDATSLQKASFGENRAYQVCDIDLTSISSWSPLTTYNGTYDGGGHAIKNLKIDVKPTAAATPESKKQMFGLFSDITGTSTLMNINLVNPIIKADFSNVTLKSDTCYVGAICGLINPEMSEDAMLKKIMASFPDELSTTVKEALAREQLQKMGSTTSKIRGCKVSNPTITVAGNLVHVGGMAGGAGNFKQTGEIKDSYTTGGNITVNDASTTYTVANISGFCGTLANGSITSCYSNIENIDGYAKDEQGTVNNVATGFVNLLAADELPQGATTVVTSCFSKKADTHATAFDNGWPGWDLFVKDEKATNYSTFGKALWPCYQWEDSWKDMGTQSSVYPTLIWETPFTVENH